MNEALTVRLSHLVHFLCERVHSELLRLVRMESPDGNRVALEPAPTHLGIANLTGTNREAVTRVFGDLTRSGLLKREGSSLVVLDIETLDELVHPAQ